MEAFDRLVDIVERLRGPGGCDWDRAQTPQSMRSYLLEETYEVLEALDSGDPAAVRAELGDLAFHVVMLSQMYAERGDFEVSDVLSGISDKMRRRHPHVFAGASAPPDWHAMKADEAGDSARSILEGLPTAMPALLRAHRITTRASRVGFDWPDVSGVRAKLREELEELDEALQSGVEERITDEFGDVLFTLVNLGRFLPVGAEDALRAATNKFERRFRAVEASCLDAGQTVSTTDVATLETYWAAAKESTR